MAISQETTKQLVVIHGWSGIVLGILLYAVLVTGMVAVFSEEISHWSAGLVNIDNPIAPQSGDATPIQDIIDRLEPKVDPEFIEEVALSGTTHGDLNIFFHRHQTNAEGVIEEYGTSFDVDPVSGEVLEEKTGSGLEFFYTDEDRALSRFLVSVHTELHLPRPWGLLLTGILGLMMMVAAVSGLIMHRHLLKDIFTLRRHNALLAVKDTHTVAGSWGLPFAFVLAFTGSFFSFAGSVGLPIMAMVGFGGDQEKMFEVIIGSQAEENTTPQKGPAVDHMLRDVKQRAGLEADFVVIEHYGRADASANFFLPAPQESLSGDTLVYQGATGEFIKRKPFLGQQESVGSDLFSIMGPLHFGNFGGLVSKAIWFALGFAMCFVTVTGINMWLERRPGKSFAWLRIGMGIATYGIPLALLGSSAAFFLSYGSGNASFWTPVGFLIVSAGVLVYAGWLRDTFRLNQHFLLASGVMSLVVVALRLLVGGPGWMTALQAGQSIIVTVDLLLICAGAVMLYRYRAHAAIARLDTRSQMVEPVSAG
ncbi:MAG: PepSY-associated TM helix domain-containing protein [Pseudomonadota bacterium]